MPQITKKSSLSQLQISISDSVSKAVTFVREYSFPSSRSSSPSGSRSLRVRCDDLCGGRASEDLSRAAISRPSVITAQPGSEEPPATRCLAADSSLMTPTTLTQTALQQSERSSPTLTSRAPGATFNHDQIQRAAGLWATDVPLTDAMSRSELALVPSGSRSLGGGELERTPRGSSPANDSNAPVSHFSIDESSEEEDGPGLENVEPIDFESDEDDQGDESDSNDDEFPTVLTATALPIRHFDSKSALKLGDEADTISAPDAESGNSEKDKQESRQRRKRAALSALGASSLALPQAVEDEQSDSEDSDLDESEPVVSEVQLDDSSNTVGLALKEKRVSGQVAV